MSSTLSVVPTDAEYAMELISQRVARGLDIEPKRRKYRHNKDSSRSESDPSERGSISDSTGQGGGSGGTPVNWQKLSERAAKPKAWASQVKGVFKDGQVSLCLVVWPGSIFTPYYVVEGSRDVEISAPADDKGFFEW